MLHGGPQSLEQPRLLPPGTIGSVALDCACGCTVRFVAVGGRVGHILSHVLGFFYSTPYSFLRHFLSLVPGCIFDFLFPFWSLVRGILGVGFWLSSLGWLFWNTIATPLECCLYWYILVQWLCAAHR